MHFGTSSELSKRGMETYFEFQALNINSIRRFQNQEDDLLANVSSKLVPP